MNKRISAVIICKNEEARIKSCLQSVKWADEIVVLDSGSNDRTLEIASEFTDKIYINIDWKGFGPQKRLAESYATSDWVLSIDSDEVVSEILRNEIIAAVNSADENSVFRLNRLTYFCGKFIRHSGWYPDRIVRLYNKKHYHYNDAFVHEAVYCDGARVVNLKGDLLHYQILSLEDYIDKRNKYARAWADNHYAKGKSTNIAEIVLRSLFAFFRHYIIRLGVLDGYHGFLISVIQMQYTFNKYNFLRFRNSK
ncbi:MAG: Two-domain glycosyltransferase [Pseudomonadota bacterium]|nr:Two-domain glycosyltransferase [Pseudomonadota bacterium]